MAGGLVTGGPSAGAEGDFRALVCVTTCDRAAYLARYLPHFAAFSRSDPRFELLVALDGDDADTHTFCEAWEVPLVYSERREGVGLSKNRVLERFGDRDYYFFLDDDVELVDGGVFPAHVALYRESGIHHLSLFERGGVRRPTGETRAGGMRIVHGMFGGGQFNFYTGKGLRQVGGWHPRFAEFRRWGHTEHSYRFWRAGLAPAPFNVAEELSGRCIWHYPPPVTRVEAVATDADQIPAPERELIDAALTHVPLQTLSPHHHNGLPPGPVPRLAATLDGGDRYPLTAGSERRRCWSDYRAWQAREGSGALGRGWALARAALLDPANPAVRRAVRGILGR